MVQVPAGLKVPRSPSSPVGITAKQSRLPGGAKR
jgi:hypothetical protein